MKKSKMFIKIKDEFWPESRIAFDTSPVACCESK